LDKIYLLTSEFSSDRAGSFRQERWASVFLRKGVEVIVLDVVGFYKVHIYHFQNTEQLLKHRESTLSKTKSRSGVRQGFFANLLRYIKHNLFLDFFFPSLLISYFKLERLGVLKGKKILMVSSPPFSLGLVSYFAKKKNNDLISIVDMRDAWAMHSSVGGLKVIKKHIEKKILSKSNYVLTVSEWLSSEFKKQYSIDPIVAYNVSTHYQNLNYGALSNFEWKEISDEITSESIKILYTGSTPPGHFDLRTFVSAIDLLAKQSRLVNFQFVFIGNCSELKSIVYATKGIESYFVFVDHLPNIKIRVAQANADVLLFFGYDADGNAGVVSTKLFEYLFLRKPILPLNVKSNSDVALLLSRFATHSISIEDSPQIQELLSKKDFIDKLPILKVSKDEFIETLLDDYENFFKFLNT